MFHILLGPVPRSSGVPTLTASVNSHIRCYQTQIRGFTHIRGLLHSLKRVTTLRSGGAPLRKEDAPLRKEGSPLRKEGATLREDAS